MKTGVAPHDRRVLIAGVALITVIVGAKAIARTTEWRVREWASATSLLAEVTRQEARARILAAERDSLVARRVRLATMDSTILDGDTPALAAAALAELMSDVAEQTTAQLGNVVVRADSSAHGAFVVVRVQATVTGNAPALVNFLAKLEASPKLVAIRELGIRLQGDQSAVQGGQALRADVVVEGLARNPTPSQRAKR